MKIRIIVLTALLAIGGCQSPADNVLNNKFASITPQKVPETLIGIWSGIMGNYLTGLNFKSDGRGVFCYSHDGAAVTKRIKYSNNIIYIQDGLELDIEKLNTDSLIVNEYTFGGIKYVYYKNTNLKESSLFCANK